MNFLSRLAPAAQTSIVEVLLNLLLACVLGLLVAGVYRVTNRHRSLSQSFLLTLVILAMVVALVMMVIGNSIARAFSLVGALSIIRFRTVVKDNRDIAYVFFALAAGMAAGVGHYPIAVFGVGLILIVLLVLDFVQFGMTTRGVYLLRFQAIPSDQDDSGIQTVFDSMLSSYRRLATKTVRMGQYVEHSYLVRLKKNVNEQKLISHLSALEGMERVNLIAENSEGEA